MEFACQNSTPQTPPPPPLCPHPFLGEAILVGVIKGVSLRRRSACLPLLSRLVVVEAWGTVRHCPSKVADQQPQHPLVHPP